MPVGGRAEAGQFRLGQAAARDRYRLRLVDAPPQRLCAQQPEEGVGRGADHRVEDEVRRRVEDLLDHGLEVGVADREVTLASDLAPGRQHRLAHDPVVLPGPDVVRAEEPRPPPPGLKQVARQRHDVLVRGGASVDHVLARLETLVVRRVPEQRVVLLEEREHLLAAGAGVAADHVGDPVQQELARAVDIVRDPAAGIDGHGLEEDVRAAVVDLADGQQRARMHRLRRAGRRTRFGRTATQRAPYVAQRPQKQSPDAQPLPCRGPVANRQV